MLTPCIQHGYAFHEKSAGLSYGFIVCRDHAGRPMAVKSHGKVHEYHSGPGLGGESRVELCDTSLGLLIPGSEM